MAPVGNLHSSTPGSKRKKKKCENLDFQESRESGARFKEKPKVFCITIAFSALRDPHSLPQGLCGESQRVVPQVPKEKKTVKNLDFHEFHESGAQFKQKPKFF